MKPCHWALWLGLILPSWVKSQPSPLPLSNTATAVLRAYLYPNLNFLIPTPGKTKNKLINSVLPSRAYTHTHRPRANTCTHMHTLLQHYTKLTAFATEDAVLFFLLHRRPCPSWVSLFFPAPEHASGPRFSPNTSLSSSGKVNHILPTMLAFLLKHL